MYAGELGSSFLLQVCYRGGHNGSEPSVGDFHILIITLQAFIFMVLTIVYLSMASEEH